MPRIQPVDPNQATGKTKTLLDGVEKSMGRVPNLLRTLANSPAGLGAYLGFSQALAGSSLSAQLREQIALAVSSVNSCQYCASAHTAIGKMIGLDADELAQNLQGYASDPKVEAALQFAQSVVLKRGWVEDDELQQVRDAGYTEGELVEIIATTAFTIFTNYFNHIAETEIDFPVVEVAEPVKA